MFIWRLFFLYKNMIFSQFAKIMKKTIFLYRKNKRQTTIAIFHIFHENQPILNSAEKPIQKYTFFCKIEFLLKKVYFCIGKNNVFSHFEKHQKINILRRSLFFLYKNIHFPAKNEFCKKNYIFILVFYNNLINHRKKCISMQIHIFVCKKQCFR